MIKSTFYNLPEEKRQRIINAIFSEFASASADKISINRIIKVANISRGSFYQYFEDKVDLVEVLIKTFIDISIDKANIAFNASDGDIFDTYSNLLDLIADISNNSEQKMVMKNLIHNIKANDNLISDYMTNRFKHIACTTDILKNFKRDNLKYSSDEDVDCLIQILNQVFKNALFNLFVIGKPYDEVKKTFNRKLEIIKAGAVCMPESIIAKSVLTKE